MMLLVSDERVLKQPSARELRISMIVQMSHRHVWLSLVSFVAVLMAGCARPYLPPAIEPADSDGHFDGVLPLLETYGALHLLWIHGMCPHSKEDWADPRAHALASRLGVEQPRAERVGDVVYRYRLDYRGRTITLDMIVWSPLIEQRRASLCFDSRPSGDGPAHDACGDKARYPYERAALNDGLKSGLMNACLADALIYVGDQGREVREHLLPDIERALSGSPARSDRAVVLISESLGSKVMFDIVQQIMGNTSPSALAADARATLAKTRQLVMFANQIPMLDLVGPAPSLPAKDGATAAGDASSLRGFIRLLKDYRTSELDGSFARLKLVAFSDPNDVLSYRLPRDYFPEAYRTDVINVLPSNDVVWFGLLENPLTAHQGYADTDDVMQLFLCGNPVVPGCLPAQ